MTEGFLYIATGHPYYFRAAARSARSVRAAMPDAHITVITDSDEDADVFDTRLAAETDPERRYFSKVVNMARTPYDRTVFLDADTLVLNPVGHLFAVLDRFDFAMPHAFYRGPDSWYRSDAFPGLSSLSSSLLVFRRNAVTDAVLAAWRADYLVESAQRPLIGDQGLLSAAVYGSEARLYVTAPEDHFHIGLPSAAHGPISIVTGEKQDMLNPALMDFLNSDKTFRSYLPRLRKLGLVHFGDDGRQASERVFEDTPPDDPVTGT